ncbi:phage head spike fiber domain-containing protein [Winogradskyella pulchriflava]|uniref:Lipoprotein n=1 Tax=Winogradskyella pulchriflava TaxID=1110688 RepID=A0ABV6Q7P4_9FLAO
MNRIILILLLALFSCKNKSKKIPDNDGNKLDTPIEVVTKIEFAPFPAWGTVGTEIKETSETYLGESVYLISRNKELTESSYAHTRSIFVEYEMTYRASVIVKKAENGSLFGLRIMGVYPDRVDAVFNLEDGTVKGVQKTRDFESENATIEELGDGWYKCIVSAVVVADDAKIFLGPTKGNENVNGWTIRTPDNCDIYVLPSSLTLEKVSIE